MSPDSRFIISSSYDKSIKIIDINAKQEVHHFVGAHDGKFKSLRPLSRYLAWINSIAVTPDGQYVFSSSYDKSIKMFDLQTKQQEHQFADAHNGIFRYWDSWNREICRLD